VSQSLGTLYVDLKASTADFVSGMSKASYTAKQTGREIESAFSRIGSIAGSALSPIGTLGPAIGAALASMGSAANAAIKQFSGLGSGLASIAGLGGAAAAGFTAIAAGAIGIALHAAESAAKLNQLSQATGVSVEALSGLGFVAKQVGVDQQTLAQGLDRMSKSAFAAATAPAGAVNAYTRLGIAVRDSSGQIRSTEAIFADLAAKFAAMPDGITKSALAMQIFGRGGAEIIPVLNLGRQGVQDLLDTAQKLGVVMDTATAAAAERFSQGIGVLEAGAQGLANTLMRDLLPALTAVEDRMVSAFKDKDSGLVKFIGELADLVKGTIGVADTWITAGETISDVLAAIDESAVENGRGVHDSIAKALVFDFSGAEKAASDSAARVAAIWSKFSDTNRKRWADDTKFLKDLTAKSSPSAPPPGPGAKGADTTPLTARSNAIAETIAKLIAQENAEGRLANAISSVTANTILATAAANAQKEIDDLEVRSAREKITVTESEKSTIRDVIALTEAYKAAYSDNKAVEESIQKTTLETKSLGELANAYGVSAEAVKNAELAAKVAPFQQQAEAIDVVIEHFKKLGISADLTHELDKTISDLKKTGASAEELKPLEDAFKILKTGGASADVLAPLENAYTELTTKIERMTATERTAESARESASFAQTITDLQQETQQQERLTLAILAGAEAAKQQKIEGQVEQYEKQNPLLSKAPGGEVDSYRQSLQQLGELERVNAAAEEVAASQSFEEIGEKIAALEELRAKEVAAGEDRKNIAATDALIHSKEIDWIIEYQKYVSKKIDWIIEYQKYVADTTNQELLGNAKLFDSQQQLLEQWDEAAMKVGDLSEKFQAFLNEMSQEGQNLGENLFGNLKSYIGGVEDQLAKLVVTGRANFQKLMESFEESLVKSTIQKGVSALSGGLETAIFGEKFPGEKEGKLGASAGNPMFVREVNARAGGVAAAPIGGSNSSLSGIAPGAPATPPFFSPSEAAAIGAPGLGPSGSSLSDLAAAADKPDGSTSTNAFYVTPVDEAGDAIGGKRAGGASPESPSSSFSIAEPDFSGLSPAETPSSSFAIVPPWAPPAVAGGSSIASPSTTSATSNDFSSLLASSSASTSFPLAVTNSSTATETEASPFTSTTENSFYNLLAKGPSASPFAIPSAAPTVLPATNSSFSSLATGAATPPFLSPSAASVISPAAGASSNSTAESNFYNLLASQNSSYSTGPERPGPLPAIESRSSSFSFTAPAAEPSSPSSTSNNLSTFFAAPNSSFSSIAAATPAAGPSSSSVAESNFYNQLASQNSSFSSIEPGEPVTPPFFPPSVSSDLGSSEYTSTTGPNFYDLLAGSPLEGSPESPAGAYGLPPLPSAPPIDITSGLAGLELPESSTPPAFPGSVSTTIENLPLTTSTLTNFSDLLASEAAIPPALPGTAAAPSGGLLGNIFGSLFGSKSGRGGAGGPTGAPSSPLYTVNVSGPTSGFSGVPGAPLTEGSGGGGNLLTGAGGGASGLIGGLSVSIEKFFANLFGVQNPKGLPTLPGAGSLYNGPAVPGYGGAPGAPSSPLGILGSLLPIPGATTGTGSLGTAANPMYVIVVSGAAGPLSPSTSSFANLGAPGSEPVGSFYSGPEVPGYGGGDEDLGDTSSSAPAGGLSGILAMFKSQGSSSSTALGTAANPMYVIDAEGGSGSGGLGGGGSLGGLFGSGGDDSGSASGADDSGGDLGDLFGGFMASGGDVMPGQAYIVGERRPELFIPGQSGHIHPTTDLPGSGGGHTTQVSAHFHGVTDMDSFRKSQGQILSELHRTVSIANERNRR